MGHRDVPRRRVCLQEGEGAGQDGLQERQEEIQQQGMQGGEEAARNVRPLIIGSRKRHKKNLLFCNVPRNNRKLHATSKGGNSLEKSMTSIFFKMFTMVDCE